MGKRPAMAIVLVIGIALIAAAYRYYEYSVRRQFTIAVNTVCDPATESCFMADCSPADDPECDQTPYKKVEILARNAPECLKEHTCESFTCDGIAQCEVSYCSLDAIEEGEICSESGVPQQ